MTIPVTSVARDGQFLTIVSGDGTFKRQVGWADLISSVIPDTNFRVLQVYRNASGNLVVTYEDSNGDEQIMTIDVGAVATHAALTATHGALDIADKSDIAVDANLSAAAQAAITASHARSHSIIGTSDHASSATNGKMLKANANGLPVDASNTDTEVADAVTKKHTQNSDTGLGTQAADIVMGTHQVTGLSVPDAAAEAIRQTTKITEAALEDAVDKKHTQGADTALGAVGTKNPPVDADKVLYRDSVAADVLVTSTWTQVKAFLKTYWDTLYEALGAVATHAGLSDPHTGYRLESADHSHATTGAQAGQLDHGAAMVAASLLDDDHTQYQKESEKDAANGYCGLDADGLVANSDLQITVPKGEGARVYNSANISIPNTTWTILTFDTERYDTDAIHSLVTATGRFTCKTAGKYLIIACVEFASNATGLRQLLINVGVVSIAGQYLSAVNGGTTVFSVATVYDMAVNDYAEVYVYQSSGAALNVVAHANFSPEFMMQRIG